MAIPWKRSDWNAIIQQVNDLIADRPQGCAELTPLDEVGPDHRWSTNDISLVRSRLFDMCNDSTFNTLAYKWQKDVIDEINANITNGWCGCEETWTGPYSIDFPSSSDTRNDVVYPADNWQIVDAWQYCDYDPQIWPITGTTNYHTWDSVTYWSPFDLQVGPAGITGRTAKLMATGTIIRHGSMHQWMGWVNGGFQDNNWDYEEPYSLETATWSVGEDGYLHRPYEMALVCNNHIQDITSNCPSFEFHGETIDSYNLSDSHLWIDRP